MKDDWGLEGRHTIPHTNGLVKGGRNNEILLGVELGTHDVVVVACHCADWYCVSIQPRRMASMTLRKERFCQFHIRIVWSSLALTIQGSSWWKKTVRT